MGEKERYIYAAPYGDGRWQVWGSAEAEYTAELFQTKAEAIAAIPDYAKLLVWKEYQISIDE